LVPVDPFRGELKDVMLGALPFVLTMFAMLALWLPSLFS